MMNPCSEIVLGDPQPVMPWVQVQLEQCFLQKQGKPIRTPEQIQERIKELENHNTGDENVLESCREHHRPQDRT